MVGPNNNVNDDDDYNVQYHVFVDIRIDHGDDNSHHLFFDFGHDVAVNDSYNRRYNDDVDYRIV